MYEEEGRFTLAAAKHVNKTPSSPAPDPYDGYAAHPSSTSYLSLCYRGHEKLPRLSSGSGRRPSPLSFPFSLRPWALYLVGRVRRMLIMLSRATRNHHR